MVLEPVEDRRIRTSCLAFLGLNAQQSGLPPWDSCDRRIFLVKAEVLQHPSHLQAMGPEALFDHHTMDGNPAQAWMVETL